MESCRLETAEQELQLPPTQYGVIYASTSSGYASTAAGTSGYPLLANSGAAPTFQQLSLSGSGVSGLLPVTAGGTNAATANAGYIFAGPATGGAAAPGFRAIASSDLPLGTSSQWTTVGSTINYLSGFVGIGTAAPQAQLDVYGTGVSSAILVPRDTSLNRPSRYQRYASLQHNDQPDGILFTTVHGSVLRPQVAASRLYWAT